MDHRFMNKETKNPLRQRRLILCLFYLLFLFSGIWMGQISCTSDKGEKVDEEESSIEASCSAFIDESLSEYASNTADCYCVGEDVGTWCSPDDAESYDELADALAATDGGEVVILLQAGVEYEEGPITLGTNNNNVILVGGVLWNDPCGDPEAACTTRSSIDPESLSKISYDNMSGPVATSHTLEISNGVLGGKLVNLKITGIVGQVGTSDVSIEDYLDASTVLIDGASDVEFHNVYIKNNYYRALHVKEGSSDISLDDVTIGASDPGDDADYDTTVGIYNEGSLEVNNTDISTNVDFGIVSTGASSMLAINVLESAVPLLLFNSASADLTGLTLEGSLGIYAESINNMILESSLVSATTGVVGCQLASVDPADSTYTFEDNEELNNLYFGTITVNGEGNSILSFSYTEDTAGLTDGVFDDVPGTPVESIDCDYTAY